MKLTREETLSNFKFWAGAADRVKYLTENELDTIEAELEELYPDGMDETYLNDMFWFDFDFICELIGTDEESVIMRDEP